MATYDDIVERTGTSKTAREIPETVSDGVLSEVIEGSAALKLIPQQQMNAVQHRIRVQKSFATAYWLDGATRAEKDKAFKPTTSYTWDNVYLTPDELAVLVPVPDNWMADSDIAWSEIKDEIRRQFIKKIDQAVFFGAGDVPQGFSGPSGGLVGGAVAAGNTVTIGDTVVNSINDIALDMGAVAQELAEQGYDPTGFAAKKGFSWRFVQHRTTTGETIFSGPTAAAGTPTLFGQPYTEVGNGSWDSTVALAITGEWESALIGLRQGMTFSIHEDGIIQDPDTGDILYNAMQQDGKVLRAVMRLGFAVAQPVKVLGGTFGFGVLQPVGAS